MAYPQNDKSDLQIVLENPCNINMVTAVLNLNVNIRVGMCEVPHHQRIHAGAGDRRNPNRDFLFPVTVLLADTVVDFLYIFQNDLSAYQEFLARGRQFHAAAFPVEEGDTQFLLQILDGGGYRRLRNVKLGGRMCKILIPLYRLKIFQLS